MDSWGSFEALFDAEHERCVRVATRIVGDGARGEELAAEAFIRAWARWPWLRRIDSPGGWVLKVTVNLAIDATRKKVPVVGAAPPIRIEDHTVDRLVLADALDRLPSRQRAIVCLRYLEGLTEAEAAATLGISASAAKTHHRRALAALRSSLSG